MRQPILSAEQLTFIRAGKAIINAVDFTLEQGTFNVLIGTNGAGKSTLMRLLSGYLPPDSGNIALNGKLLAHYPARELAQYRAVMQQQNQISFPFLAKEVIEMGGYHRRLQPQDLQAVIDATESEKLLNKRYQQLSGGEQQRIQLARVLYQLWDSSMQNKLLFLDEPTSALDLYHQQQSLRLLKKLCETKQLTVCAILHDLNLAALYADQIILLAEGKIQAQGTPQTVISEQNIAKWYGSQVRVIPHIEANLPQVLLCR